MAPYTHKSRSVKQFLGSPNLEPRWPPDPQLGAKMVPRPPTWSQGGPQTPQLGAKMATRPSNPGTVAGLAVRQLYVYIYIY